ncbi:sarcosine oxidase subunit gamma [Pseudonocardia nigra]|uniref:sarcosine oxidase subunit gamma n=1 Tax=Pseudonocardia nigra TaxID=1921578 RepID=UPI001C5CFA0D|nr:sarcosine oxidase subunit gamma family protein [Pseudonocardia nigra]
MSDLVALARSPIAAADPVGEHGGWEVSVRRSTAALTITDCTPLAKVAVRAPVDGAMQRALGVPFGRAARSGDGELVVGSGPGGWLVLAPVGTAARVRSRLAATAAATGEFVSVVDLTHGRALVRLRGGASADLLAKVCAVDLSDAVTPDGAAFRSSVARLVTDVVRDDVDGTRSYLLHCERSSGQYLHDALLDAGAEFGIDAAGFDAAGFDAAGSE